LPVPGLDTFEQKAPRDRRIVRTASRLSVLIKAMPEALIGTPPLERDRR
jgi:hypothetical protein